MENHLYICQYCSIEYKPRRRQKQKYCSNSCRTRAFTIRKFKGLNKPAIENKNLEEKKPEGITWGKVGSAAAGTLAVNIATNLFTREENKPATKKDIKEVKQLLMTQHHPIKNMPDRYDGARPFYDLQTKNLVYLIKPMSHGPKKY